MVREQQSTIVEIPEAIAEQANRIADQQHWTLHQAIIYLLNRGLHAQKRTEKAVTEAYETFMNTPADKQEEAGKDLIRSIFSPKSVA